jgi:hypothetical protein
VERRDAPRDRAHHRPDPTEDRFTGPTHPERFAFIPDPDDRKFAALADAAGAVLISNDEHLLAHRDRMAVPVLTPSACWKQLERGTDSRPKARNDDATE